MTEVVTEMLTPVLKLWRTPTTAGRNRIHRRPESRSTFHQPAINFADRLQDHRVIELADCRIARARKR